MECNQVLKLDWWTVVDVPAELVLWYSWWAVSSNKDWLDVHLLLVTEILSKVEPVHDWTMSWDRCFWFHEPFAWYGLSNDYCWFHFVTLLECNVFVHRSRGWVSLLECKPWIGCWPIIRGDYLEYACSTQTMLKHWLVSGEQTVSDIWDW